MISMGGMGALFAAGSRCSQNAEFSHLSNTLSKFSEPMPQGLKMLRIFIWAINKSRAFMEDKCKKMLKSAEVNGVHVELLGIGHEFVSHSQRMEILHEG